MNVDPGMSAGQTMQIELKHFSRVADVRAGQFSFDANILATGTPYGEYAFGFRIHID